MAGGAAQQWKSPGHHILRAVRADAEFQREFALEHAYYPGAAPQPAPAYQPTAVPVIPQKAGVTECKPALGGGIRCESW